MLAEKIGVGLKVCLKACTSELTTALLIGFAALGSAWCAFQSTQWSSVKTSSYARATKERAESLRTSNRASMQIQVDVGAFAAWLEMHVEGREKAAHVLQERFRTEFLPAFDAWLGTGTGAALPPGTPFDRPEYRLATRTESERLAQESEASSAAAETANDNGSRFVFAVVLFTIVVVLTGIAAKVGSERSRALFSAAAALALVVGFAFVLSLPQHVGLSVYPAVISAAP